MKQRKPAMRHKLGTWPLKNIAEMLNSKPSQLREEQLRVRDELRRLFARYRESGPNLEKMMGSDPKLGLTLTRMFDVVLRFTTDGCADLELLPHPIDPDEYDARYQATQIFARLIINKDWAKLDGPCSQCSKYFVRQRRSFRTKEHVFCSRECSGPFMATVSMKAKRASEYETKLKKAQAAAKRWQPGAASFKEFVRRETGLTPTWITQAIKRRKLREPASALAQITKGRKIRKEN